MTDQDILARTCWGEFRSGGYTGMQAVANVIMNRVAKNTWYGHGVIDVCLKSEHGVYQFDCNDPSDPNFEKCNDVTSDDSQFAIAQQIATLACNGHLADITAGSLNYFTDDGSEPMPYWLKGKTPALTVGVTLFFNNID